MTGILRRDAVRLDEEARERTLEALTAFLRTESFAAHTYDFALARIAHLELHGLLRAVRNSHAGRACLLRERAVEFGGERMEMLTPWGAFANAFHRILRAEDTDEIVDALHEGELFCTRDYEIDLVELDPALQAELAPVLFPEQRRTDAIVSALRLQQPGPSIARSRRIA